MKYFKFFAGIITVLFIIIVFSNCSGSGKNTGNNQSSAFKQMVDSQNFIFTAQSVIPFRENYRYLTSLYNVIISKDTLRSYLPYFGRIYVAPSNPDKLDLDFTSTNFSYEVTPHKKNGWEIGIKPKDYPEIQQYLFTIYDNGAANLTVTRTSADPITFNGIIQKNK